MTTTIQIDEKTLKNLAALKQQLKARSYQEVIEILVSQKRKLPRSLFGLAKGSRPYSHTPEAEHVL
jgi:predicted CopG family antitoxin